MTGAFDITDLVQAVLSLINGIAIKRLVDGISQAVRLQSKIWPKDIVYYTGSVLLFLAILQYWWGMLFEPVEHVSFRVLVLEVIPPCAYLLAADALAFKTSSGSTSKAPWQHYQQNCRIFCVAAIVASVTNVICDLLTRSHTLLSSRNEFRLIACILLGILVVCPRTLWLHISIQAILALLLFAFPISG